MAQQTSVVTAERFNSAMSYAEYIAAISVNRDQFEHYYNTCHLTEHDVAAHVRPRKSGPTRS